MEHAHTIGQGIAKNTFRWRGLKPGTWHIKIAFAVFIVALVGLGTSAMAEDDVWSVGPLQIPPPAGASVELKKSIAATSQPDIAKAASVTFKSDADWTRLTDPLDKASSVSNMELAEKWAVNISEKRIADVAVFMVTPAKIDPELANKMFVHTHGGAFVLNAGRAGLREAILIANNIGIPVLSVDYRMPPKHPFPASVDDVVAVWKHLLKTRLASTMAIGGTSAGGNLALASVLRLQELKLDLPAVVMASTPWADLTKTGDSYYTHAGVDRVLVTYEGVLAAAAKAYANGRDLKSPLISPVYGDYTGFPPVILFSGTRDLFLSGTVRTHRRMRAANVQAELHVFEAMSHANWTILTDLPESRAFTSELGAFLKRH
ncbi:MAG: alpha/beta hydrolase [Hyphomicrobiaceae bacterium]